MPAVHRLLLAGLLLVVAACSDGTSPDARPTTLSIITGDDQRGTVGQPLPQPLTVRVLDQQGAPMRGVPVTWSSAAGAVTAATPATDADGRATATWTLGTTAGAVTASATVSGLSPALFTATAEGGSAATITLSSDSVSLEAGATYRFEVDIRDEHGNAVSPALTWTSSDEEVVTVAPDGTVSVRRARVATVTASAEGVTARAVVSVRPGPPSKLLAHAGSGQRARAATAVPEAPVARVTDDFDNGIAGIPVSWQVSGGGGQIDPATSTTDSLGIATTAWTLGRHAGPNGLTAASAAVSGSTAAFSAEATPNGTISGTITVTDEMAGHGPVPHGIPIPPVPTVALSGTGAGPQIGVAALGMAEALPPTTGRLVVTFRPEAGGLRVPPGPSLSLSQAQSLGGSIRASLTSSPAAPDFSIQSVSPALLAARIEVRDRTREASVRAALQADPRVASVEPEIWLRASAELEGSLANDDPHRRLPNDPLYAPQAWNYGLIDLPRAWRQVTGSSSVVVAVLDSGIRFEHPDLAANLTSDGYDFVSQQQVSVCGVARDNAGDGNGYDPDPTEPIVYNCANGEPSTAGGHGLHVAGIIGAVGNNGVGLTGVNWNVRIRPVRVLGIGGVGTSYDIAQGILYAAGLPADDGKGGTVQAPSRAHVINMSLGGGGESHVLEAAVKAAANAGSLLVASAGNGSTAVRQIPAYYPEVISVAAVSAYGRLATYSNFGSTVDIAAPGGDYDNDADPTFRIASTMWNFRDSLPVYTYLVGTSMAAPHVSGVAALLLAHEPNLTAAQLRSRLLDYAVDHGQSGIPGAGILNARNSLTRTHAAPGTLRVRLYDARTGAIVRTASVTGGQYSFEELPDGEYHVFAGRDEAGDGAIGRPGRIWGGYASDGAPGTVAVDGAGTYPASVSLGYPAESEPNGSPETANRLVVGGYLHGTRGSSGDVDYFEVTVPAGEYTFETSGWGDTACGYAHAMNTTLELLRADGSQIAVHADIDAGRRNHCSRITRSLGPGTYYLRVTGSGGPAYRIEARQGS